MPFRLQDVDQIDHLGVAQVGDVFLERHAQDQHLAAAALWQIFRQLLVDAPGGEGGHGVVDFPSGQDDFGMMPHLFR